MVAKLLFYYSKEKDLVLDPFMGTGTTAVACRECDRKYIGFEISEKQVEFSKKRCSQMTIFDI